MKERRRRFPTLGVVLRDAGLITEEQLCDALRLQNAGDRRKLGAILIHLEYVKPDQIEYALRRQRAQRGDMAHEEGVRLIDRAVAQAKASTAHIEELTVAAEKLTDKAKH